MENKAENAITTDIAKMFHHHSTKWQCNMLGVAKMQNVTWKQINL